MFPTSKPSVFRRAKRLRFDRWGSQWTGAIEVLEHRIVPSQVGWTGQGDGTSWNVAGNWSTNKVPGTTDDVTIALANATVHAPSGNLTFNSLTINSGSTLDFDSVGGTHRLSGTIVNQGNVTVKAGAFVAVNPGNANATFQQDGGKLDAGATGAVLAVEGGQFVVNGGQVVNGNLGVFAAGCTLTVNNTVTSPTTISVCNSNVDLWTTSLVKNDSQLTTLRLRGGAILNCDATLVAVAGLNNAAPFNRGTIVLEPAAGTYFSKLAVATGAVFTNQVGATIDAEQLVSNATTTISGSVINQGTVTVGTNALLAVNPGNANATFQQDGGKLDAGATGAVLAVEGGQFVVNGGQVVNGNLGVFAAGCTLTVNNTVTSPTTISVCNSNVDLWTTSLVKNDSQLTTLRLRGGAILNCDATLVAVAGLNNAAPFNRGTIVLEPAAGTYFSKLAVATGAVFTNQVGATIDAEPGPIGSTIDLSGELHNSGTVIIRANATLGASAPNASHINSGSLWLGQDAKLTVKGQSLTNQAGGTVGGSGTIDVSSSALFNNGGTVAPGANGAPAKLTIAGDFHQSSQGMIAVTLGGTTPGSQFDQVAVTGTAYLAGTLDATTRSPYTPTAGDAFKVVTFKSRQGSIGFSDTHHIGLTSALNLSDFTLTAVGPVSMPGVDITPTAGLVTTEAGGTASFSVVLASAPTSPVTILFTSSNPTEGIISSTPNPLTFNASNWMIPQSVTIKGQDDHNDSAVDYTILGTAGSGDANYDKRPVPVVSVTNLESSPPPMPGAFQFNLGTYDVREDAGSVVVTVVRSNGSDGNVSVNFVTSDGSARQGIDYTTSSRTLQFAAGETSKSVSIPILNDRTPDGTQTVLLSLSNPTNNAGLGALSTATLYIRDVPGALQFSAPTYSATEGGPAVTVTVTRSLGNDGDVKVNYATGGGTATPATDYTAASGTLDFPDGVMSRTFTIPIADDTISEGRETVVLTLSSPTNGAVLGSQSTATLNIDDRPGAFQFDAPTYSVREDQSITIRVNRTGGTSGAATVKVSTANGTATQGSDYQPVSYTLAFADGQASLSFPVPILQDSTQEATETVLLTLSNPTNGTTLGAQSSATLNIQDLPGVLQFSTATYSAVDGGPAATITVTRTVGSGGNVKVNYATVGGTATPGVDYAAASGTLDFPEGVLSRTFTVSILNGIPGDGRKTVALALSGPSGGATLGAQAKATINIDDVVAPYLVTNTNDSGPGSLRQAILNANAAPGTNTIRFQVGTGPRTIALASPLPSLTDAAVIDGTSQPGYAGIPLIGLSGAGAPVGANGLTIVAANSAVMGLAIFAFSGEGILVQGASASGNQVLGCYIGVDPQGVDPRGNGIDGIRIDGAPGNTIGGTAPGAGNLISGNCTRRVFASAGVKILGAGATGNVLLGNRIGTDAAGSGTNANLNDGVDISDGASGNTIGGPARGASNVISGNVYSGVALFNSPSNAILGNFIGSDATGLLPLGNGTEGVYVNNSPSTRIGGAVPGSRNVIVDNGLNGVVLFIGSSSCTVQGNSIGVSADGSRALGNKASGVNVFAGAHDNLIGGTGEGMRNVISGNAAFGVAVADTTSTANLIQGNFIGTDPSGQSALGNGRDGVTIQNAPGNTIGGSSAGARNIISGNGGVGVWVVGQGAVGTSILGNFIGTDVFGIRALGNAHGGVVNQDVAGNTIGGTAAGAGNLISGNAGPGIEFNSPGSTLNTVQGNTIGADAFASRSLANQGDGIRIINCAENLIGGTSAGAGNVIAGNAGDGLWIDGVDATANRIQGNSIGTDAKADRALGNGLRGIAISNSPGNVIGGRTLGAGNVIAYNADRGVGIGSGVANDVEGNSIFGNAGLGIDLGFDGVTPNDPGDSDSGPNALQNAPVLTSVTNQNGATMVQGALESTPGHDFWVFLYVNADTDPSGYGQGETPLVATLVHTDASGHGSFSLSLGSPLPLGQFVTSTATDSSGNTSEFSAAVPVTIPSVVQFAAATFSVSEENPVVTVTVTRSASSTGVVLVQFATGDGTARAGEDYLPVSGTLRFGDGETAKAIPIPILSDLKPDGTETFRLTLTAPEGGATLGDPSTALISIVDVPGFLQFGAPAYSAAEDDGVATVLVTRTVGNTGPVSVHYSTSDGTAHAPDDYSATSGTLSFADGELSKTFTIPIGRDSVPDGSESVVLALDSPTGGAVVGLQSTAVLTIRDGAGSLQFSAPSYVVDANGGKATITVGRTLGIGGAVSVHYATGDGTAVGGVDYASTSGILDFAEGEASKSFTITVFADTFPDDNETVNLILDGPTGGAVLGSPSTAVLTILANQPPTIGPIPPQVINEGSRLTFTATATDLESPASALTYSLVGGPSGTVIDPRTGAFSWTPTEGQGPGNYTFWVQATDNGSPPRSALQPVTINVNEVNSRPILTSPPSLTVTPGNVLRFTARASDADSPVNALTYSLIGAPPGAAIHPSSGAFTWRPTLAQSGRTYNLQVRVTDDGAPGLSDIKRLTITVPKPPAVVKVAKSAGSDGVRSISVYFNVTMNPKTAGLPGNYVLMASKTPHGPATVPLRFSLRYDARRNLATLTPVAPVRSTFTLRLTLRRSISATSGLTLGKDVVIQIQ